MTLGETVNGLMGKVVSILTGDEGYPTEDPFVFGDKDDYPVQDNLARQPEYATRTTREERGERNVTRLHGYKGHEVRIVEPRSYGDTTQIVQQLLEQKTVILNLHLLDKETSQRTIDFVCGATYALGGKPQKIGDTVFVFTPDSVQLSVEAKETNSFGVDGLLGTTF